MSELRDAIAGMLDERYADLMLDSVPSFDWWLSAADAIMALIEQSRPSRDEFERQVDELIDHAGDVVRSEAWAPERHQRYRDLCAESRREVMRMAGYPEER